MSHRPPKSRAPLSREGSASNRRAIGERRFVLVVICVFTGIAIAVGGVHAREAVDRGRAQEVISTSLANTQRHQRDFRILHGRFATWQELARRGERLAPNQRVVRTSATSSHWYLQLRDVRTGMVCDRIHELMDEAEVRPVRERCWREDGELAKGS